MKVYMWQPQIYHSNKETDEKGLVSIATITWTICKLNHSNGSKMSTFKVCSGSLCLFKHIVKI